MKYCHVGVTEYLYDREEDNIPTDPKDGSKVLIDQATRERLIAKYGIVHNDIHSSNIIRNKYDGRYILLDFGISMQGGTAIRESGLGEGALAYMAPEKILNRDVSFRTDVYSIGIVMYETLTGRVPFPSKGQDGKDYSSKVMCDFHSASTVPSIYELRKSAFESALGNGQSYEKDYPDWLERILQKCLAKKPEERYANASEIYNDFLYEMADYSQPGTAHINADAVMVKELIAKMDAKDELIKQKEEEIHSWKEKNDRLRALKKSNLAKLFSPLRIIIILLTFATAVLFLFPDFILP